MIELQNLTKIYGTNYALRGLSLNINQGQVFGLIGPNGAGKTTAMAILATLLAPDDGSARIGGCDVGSQPQQIRRLIGYMPDFFGVYDGLTAVEYLEFFAAAYHIPVARRSRLAGDLLELVNLKDKGDCYVDALSRGMKQRLALARCLVHDPPVLILDEPASGLDPRARMEVKEIVRQLGQMNKTVLISSHILPELSAMCDEIGILEKGQLVAGGTVEEITTARQDYRTLTIEAATGITELADFVAGRPLVVKALKEDNRLKVWFSGDRQAQGELLKEIIEAGWLVLDFTEIKGNLEETFMTVTGEVV